MGKILTVTSSLITAFVIVAGVATASDGKTYKDAKACIKQQDPSRTRLFSIVTRPPVQSSKRGITRRSASVDSDWARGPLRPRAGFTFQGPQGQIGPRRPLYRCPRPVDGQDGANGLGQLCIAYLCVARG